MIHAEHLTRRFGPRVAVDDLTFTVPKGQIVGFLGPNGAGKSTTLKMLSGFLPPSSGTARVAGHDIVEAPDEARRLIGYMPETFPVYPEMRVEEYLHFRAELKGVTTRRKEAVQRAMELADVADVARRLLGELSKGYKQRVGLADAVVASPPLLILDEPTEGLDPNQILRFREVLRTLGREHTIFLSTHILSEVEAVCSHVVIIHRGRIATAGPLDTVRAELDGAARDVSLVLTVKKPDEARWLDDATAALTAVAKNAEGITVVRASFEAGLVRADVRAAEGTSVEDLVARCVAAGMGVREVSPKGRSLEHVFHDLTTVEPAAAEKPAGAEAK